MWDLDLVNWLASWSPVSSYVSWFIVSWLYRQMAVVFELCILSSIATVAVMHETGSTSYQKIVDVGGGTEAELWYEVSHDVGRCFNLVEWCQPLHRHRRSVSRPTNADSKLVFEDLMMEACIPLFLMKVSS